MCVECGAVNGERGVGSGEWWIGLRTGEPGHVEAVGLPRGAGDQLVEEGDHGCCLRSVGLWLLRLFHKVHVETTAG